jgi:hypothetical protein
VLVLRISGLYKRDSNIILDLHIFFILVKHNEKNISTIYILLPLVKIFFKDKNKAGSFQLKHNV